MSFLNGADQWYLRVTMLKYQMEIEGFPNYLIHSDGRVENETTGRILKPGLSGKGYLNVILHPGRMNKTIHRLVASAYIPNPENKPAVDHINRNKTDNSVENLRWVTYAENRHNTSDCMGHSGITITKYNTYIVSYNLGCKRTTKTFKTRLDAQKFLQEK